MGHCGESTLDFYLTSLLAIDVATGWTELQAVWGKGQQRVGVPLVPVDPLETADPAELKKEGASWHETRMRQNVEALAKALK